MQVNPANAAVQAPVAPGAVAVARVVSGDLAALPVGVLLEATVTRSDPGATVLNLAGKTLTLRPPAGFPANLPAGTVLVVRLPGATTSPNPTLELVGRPVVPSGEPEARPATTSAAPQADRGERLGLTPSAAPRTNPASVPGSRVATVDVLNVLPDGRVRVRLDGGGEEVATTTARVPAGERAVVQVERTPTGLTLRPLPDSPALAADVAAALLRGTRVPDLGAALKPLLAELAALQAPQQPGQPPRVTHPEVRSAAEAVMQTLRAILPAESRPPNAGELRQLVEDGGLHFEAKLARAAEHPDSPPPKGDLKGDLLRLFQVVRDLGAADVPAARAALDGIEAQQAANVLAQANATPYFLQLPFPEGGEWRTMHLALEREARGDEAEHRGSFRLLMHVPLTDLGETWIDAGLAGTQFRAVMYLERADARDRVRAELPSLRAELSGEGFGEVLLDVRPAGDLPAARRRLGSELRAGHPESVSLLDVKA